MGTPDNKLSELVDLVKSWIPRRVEPAPLSRDFWMPDHSCRVCYECDSQFTVFNRRHHCRLCGRVFCAKCTANSLPAPSDEQKTGREDWERIRVCNYCYKQWEQGIVAVDNGNGTSAPTPGLSPSPSATSLASSQSSCTCNSGSSTVGSTPYSTGPYQRVPHNSSLGAPQSSQMDPTAIEQDDVACGTGISPYTDAGDQSSNQYSFCINRSDDEYDYYGGYPSDSESRQYCPVTVDDTAHMYGPYEAHPGEDNLKDVSCSPVLENFASPLVDGSKEVGLQEGTPQHGLDSEAPILDLEETDTEPVDFENNGLLWVPPEPEDEEDEREAILSDDEAGEGVSGEWGYLRSSDSFGSAEYRSRDKSSEEHRKAMKNVVEGHFRALIAQLLQVENLSMDNEDGKDNWLDIIASLSWEAATLLKPDMSKGGGMDPGGYVKVKCIACGRRGESKVVRGVVCKKNVAHRRMTSKIDKPRLLILGGALEYQRVTNHLSSFDTLLQQEMDHLKMAVAKIKVHDPDVLLVEKSVSRHAQEYLLGKDISLVLNIKRPLLERIARCTGAQIVPSIDHLTSPKLGYCETFHVEKLMEEHGSAGQGGKKSAKTLMFFEGCPKPFGCTILLKGANGDELKKVKHVVQYGIFAAYHLALETSFLADEGASLPELPLRSPLTVALPDKSSSIGRSISTIPGFSVTYASPSDARPVSAMSLDKGFTLGGSLLGNTSSTDKMEGLEKLDLKSNELLSNHFVENFKVRGGESFPMTSAGTWKDDSDSSFVSNAVSTSEKVGQSDGFRHANNIADKVVQSDLAAAKDGKNHNGEMGSSKEAFPPSPSDHQSILVSLSTRCVWKGTVCERAHLLRIKYYGCFDKPLGRFLRDHLFDQNYHCRSCDMPPEAHVHCYTHRQGSLTISVKNLPEFLLPGEREGKIWMWHRCLRCPPKSGFPPATRRVLMSDAAWGLSFGKFLELSFSNHAAASRVASCGHSLHRDCLCFYGKAPKLQHQKLWQCPMDKVLITQSLHRPDLSASSPANPHHLVRRSQALSIRERSISLQFSRSKTRAMAGVSLKCGDCGALLRSVEEAQEHAERTSHSNFSESTEAVLNLVCSSCGKPCRSKTETDLHTKRTGHTEFVDKTLETAKPISLEVPKVAAELADTPDATTSNQTEEMIVPEVDKKLLEELEAMGFSTARATRALHFSGNTSVEAAVNWVVEHEEDPEIDQMPLVPVNSKAEAPKPSLTPEEVKLKAQELRERARKKKEEEEKRMEREREKERIRVGKELLEAKRIEEDNERKRLLALRKAEKEEERRAREKIRQKLEEDKAERRRKLGLPPEEPSAAKPSAPVIEEKKSSLPVRPATKTEQMRECLRSLKQNHKEDDAKVKRAFQTLLTYIGNVAKNPNEEKFRKIRVTNPSFQERVGALKGGIGFMELCGFEKIEGGEFLFLPRDKVDMAVLNSAGSELDSAIKNPFFGVL